MVTYGGAYQNFFSGAFKEAFEKRYPCTLVVQAMGVPRKIGEVIGLKGPPKPECHNGGA